MMLEQINRYVLGAAVPFLLIAGGLFFCFKLRFFFLMHPIKLIKALWGRQTGGGTSSFRALTLALAGTLGVGNIVGVSAAIFMGGFGAVFWMWVSALCAMVLKYAEIVLAMRHRRYGKDGKGHGAAMYYIKECFSSRGMKRLGVFLAGIFALFCILNSITMGSVIQANAVVGALDGVFSISPAITGAVLASIAFFLVRKGGEGMARFTEKLVPVMTLGYVVLSLAVLVLRADAVGEAFVLIFKDAFSFKAGAFGIGGFLFSKALRFGTMRGLVSNEAGCGTAPAAHAVSDCKEPARQGVFGIFEVFVDTILLCTLTALVVIVSYGEVAHFGENFIMMTIGAYEAVLGSFASYFMSIAVLCFGFATIVCWAHYGIESVDYLTKKRFAKPLFIALYCLSVFAGAFAASEWIWQSADLAIGIMTVINVPVLVLSRAEIKDETYRFFGKNDK
ncbi:MAG: alanine:cation symporter family protein [Ruminococcaceae bacterium]|nr:alanine:cation symporter family protein [Oscillospiraceae bacterium]